MRMTIVFCILGIGLLSVAGCGQQYWYQEGKTFDQCKADREASRAELLKRTDVNSIGSYGRRFMTDSMQKKGYRLMTQDQLPLDAKREGSDLPGQGPWAGGYGVAGRIEK